MSANNKEQIKNRMIKKAATLWGVAANEIEMSFDPIVALLISACASEIEKISGEIKESQTRITEKLIQLMTPETIYGPKPAHAILYTEPIDDSTVIKPEFLFYFKKKIPYKKTSIRFKNIYFSPIKEFKVIDANIKYIATGDSVLELNSKKEQQLISDGENNFKLPPSTLYIGISSDSKSIDINEISFYFELLNIEDKELFYHHLRNTEWYINDKKINITDGFYDIFDTQEINLEAIFSDISNKTHTICQQTSNIYKRHFITIKANSKVKLNKSNFSELDDIITENKLKVDDDIKWIKIVFPRVISNATLKDTYCSLNCFPVLNRELISFTYQMKEFINILPIKTEDLFLDLKSIVNTAGEVYKKQSKNDLNEDKGTFVLRSDNIGKLDHRKAREYIIHLIELLKDESASFSLFNNDFLQKKLKDLNQLISLLEKKVDDTTNEVTETNYVILKPHKKKEKLLTEFWTTNGELANSIKSGSKLEVYKGIGIKQKSSSIITSSFGGKNELTMKERLDAYRRALLSRDRIVTKEDVKALCLELYSDKIKKVEIKNGYTTDIALKKGLIQCIEIILHPNPQKKIELFEWESINNNLLLFLKKNSTSVFPYKIKILN